MVLSFPFFLEEVVVVVSFCMNAQRNEGEGRGEEGEGEERREGLERWFKNKE